MSIHFFEMKSLALLQQRLKLKNVLRLHYLLKYAIISVNNENIKQWRKCLLGFFLMGGDYFKLLRFTVELRHLELLSFARASTYIASANARKWNWQIYWPSNHRSKNQNFRNPTNYIPSDPEFYADYYSQKDYTLESNCKKDFNHSVSLYPKTKFGAKMKIFEN